MSSHRHFTAFIFPKLLKYARISSICRAAALKSEAIKNHSNKYYSKAIFQAKVRQNTAAIAYAAAVRTNARRPTMTAKKRDKLPCNPAITNLS
jgi:hypothetical protein